MTDRPRENGCTADTQAISDLLERIGAIQNNPDYIANDLVMQLHEIKTMADKGMYPRSIAMVCRSAARTADKLAQATGNAAFTDTAESLRFMAQNYCPFLSHTNNDPGVEIIYTATGGEYIMPDELEEYRKDNPVGAAMWEEQNQKAQEVQQLTFNVDPDPLDPKLDPRSPDFDPAAWKIAMEELQGTATERMQQAMDKVQKHIFGALDTQNAQYIEVTGAMAESVTSIARNAMAGITAFINSDVYHAVKESMQILRDFVEENRDLFEAAADAAEEIKPLVPFLQQELDEMAKDPKYAHATLDDLLERGFDELGNATESPWGAAIERAREKKRKFDAAAAAADEVEKLAESISLLEGLNPSHHTMPNNKLMNALEFGITGEEGSKPTPIIGQPEFDMPIFKASKRTKAVENYTMAAFDPDEEGNAITAVNLSEYERQVSDAVASLWIEAQKNEIQPAFTTDMVYRAMPGGGDKASPQQRGAITKAIEKMRRLHITVDATEEMRRRGVIGSGETMLFDDYFLSARRAQKKTKNGGKTVTAYLLNTEPLILSYSRMSKELITVDAKYLEVHKVKKDTISTELVMMNAGRQAMTGYMLRRIAIMKRDIEAAKEAFRDWEKKRKKDSTLEPRPVASFRKQRDIISFDTLFEATEQSSTNRETQRRNREFCFEVLDYWKASGYIRGYKPKTQGRSITGVELSL